MNTYREEDHPREKTSGKWRKKDRPSVGVGLVGGAQVCSFVDGSRLVVYESAPGCLSRVGGPAVVRERADGTVLEEEFWVDGVRGRVGGPAVRGFWDDGGLSHEEFWVDGVRDRVDGPAVVAYHPCGVVIFEEWWRRGVLTGRRDWSEAGQAGEPVGPAPF